MIGAKIRDELFGPEPALGKLVRVGGLQFRVIGVLEAKGQILAIDMDDTAYIPAARALELYNRDGLMEIDVTYAEGMPARGVTDALKTLLKARHGREDFTLTTQEDMLRTLSKILDILTMAVGALGGISLLVGGMLGLALGIGIAQPLRLAVPTLPVHTPITFVPSPKPSPWSLASSPACSPPVARRG